MQLLSDPRFREAPISTAMAYSQAAITGNWKNTFLFAFAIVLLGAAQMVPLIGMIASLAQTLLLYALAYWLVDRIKENRDLGLFFDRMRQENPAEALFGFLSPAGGFYVGFLLFSLVMTLITVGLFWLSGGFTMMATITPPAGDVTAEAAAAFYGQILSTSTPALLFILITSLFFGYLWPLVYGYALFQRTFSDAFNAVLMFFSTRFWSAAFTGTYFKLSSLWMLILFGAFLLMGVTFATLLLIPLGVLLLLWIIYFTAAVSATAYHLSDNI